MLLGLMPQCNCFFVAICANLLCQKKSCAHAHGGRLPRARRSTWYYIHVNMTATQKPEAKVVCSKILTDFWSEFHLEKLGDFRILLWPEKWYCYYPAEFSKNSCWNFDQNFSLKSSYWFCQRSRNGCGILQEFMSEFWPKFWSEMQHIDAQPSSIGIRCWFFFDLRLQVTFAFELSHL